MQRHRVVAGKALRQIAEARKTSAAALPAALLLIALVAGCGGTDVAGTRSQPAATAAGGNDASTDPTTVAPSEDESAASSRINPIVDLCGASELSEKASALYPGHDIKCIPGSGTPTPSHQVSSASWTAGEVDPSTDGIADEHTIQAIIEGNTPTRHTRVPHLLYENECPPPTPGVLCEDSQFVVEGTKCLLRKGVLEVGGPTITTWQAGCYIGRDSETGLDVGVQTAATKVNSADQIEDFTGAVIRAVQDD